MLLKYNINTMAFLSLSFFVIATSCVSDSYIRFNDQASEAYKEARDQLEMNLYSNLMSRSQESKWLEQNQCIKQHLNKAERDLVIPKHLQAKSRLSDTDKKYMKQWAQCHVDIYNSLISTLSKKSFIKEALRPKMSEFYYSKCQVPLKDAIQAIKDEDHLTVDATAEAAQTIKILEAATKEFSKD